MEPATLVSALLAYRYWILLPLAIIEGPILAFVSGMLVSLNILDPGLVLLILVLGDVIPDTCFYTLGRYGRSYGFVARAATRLRITDEHLARAETLWRTRPGATMLMSKFAYGIAAAFLFMAGALRMPARLFFGYSISISVIHYSIMLGLGYYFGTTALAAGDLIRTIEYGAAGVAAVVGLYIVALWYMRKRFDWNSSPHA